MNLGDNPSGAKSRRPGSSCLGRVHCEVHFLFSEQNLPNLSKRCGNFLVEKRGDIEEFVLFSEQRDFGPNGRGIQKSNEGPRTTGEQLLQTDARGIPQKWYGGTLPHVHDCRRAVSMGCLSIDLKLPHQHRNVGRHGDFRQRVRRQPPRRVRADRSRIL